MDRSHRSLVEALAVPTLEVPQGQVRWHHQVLLRELELQESELAVVLPELELFEHNQEEALVSDPSMQEDPSACCSAQG